MSPYRTPRAAPPPAPDSPVLDDDWMVLGLPLCVSLLGLVPWLVGARPWGAEPSLALAIVVICGVALVRERARRRRATRGNPDDR